MRKIKKLCALLTYILLLAGWILITLAQMPVFVFCENKNLIDWYVTDVLIPADTWVDRVFLNK